MNGLGHEDRAAVTVVVPMVAPPMPWRPPRISSAPSVASNWSTRHPRRGDLPTLNPERSQELRVIAVQTFHGSIRVVHETCRLMVALTIFDISDENGVNTPW